MKKIITKDNSVTFYNEEIKDYYHSKSGAKEEALEKHAKALEVKKAKNPIIFDMFFGLGYNSAAALDLIKEPCRIYCFENDTEILKNMLKIEADFKSFKLIQKFIKSFLDKGSKDSEFIFQENNITLIMLFGDAKQKIKEIKEKADFVFFDPFSPSKVPELWSEDFLKNIKEKMKKGAKLSTYSFSKAVRDNFQNAGFKIKKGPVVGRYTPSLIAIN